MIVYMSMSDHEGFCVPIVEAQALGLPVVAMDSSAIRGTAGNGQLIAAPPIQHDDYVFYALLLEEVFQNAELRRTIVKNGYRNVDARFRREVIENGFMQALLPMLREFG